MPPQDLTQQNASAIAYLREHHPEHHALIGLGDKRRCPVCPYTFLRPAKTDRCPLCGYWFFADPIHDAAWWARLSSIIPDPKVSGNPRPNTEST